MKKAMILVAMALLLPTVLRAQTYDTIYNRAVNGYYYRWYDTCTYFQKGFCNAVLEGFSTMFRDSSCINIMSSYTPRPMRVTGGIIMVYMAPTQAGISWLHEREKPEYVLLYQYDANLDSMILLDSARWDTLTPKIMKFPLVADTTRARYAYCYGYEAKFASPRWVDSTFYLGGTHNNNIPIGFLYSYTFKYRPVQYADLILDSEDGGCYGDTTWFYLDSLGWHRHMSSAKFFGGVIPTVDTFRLEVATNDRLRGLVSGGGTYTDMSLCTIRAIALEGYRFSHWDDGNCDNPRQVLLTQDTLFTAYFVGRNQVWADVRSSDDSMGTVTGGGAYYEGDTAILTATAMEHSKFLYWSDSVRDNPRLVELTQDTVFTAVFGPLGRYRVEALANNSDRGRVEGGGEYTEGDRVTLTALPYTGFGFLRWDDGEDANPRSFVLAQDTAFTAIFVSREAIEEAEAGASGFELLPNPASGEVRIVTEGEGFEGGTLTVSDAAGREVQRRELARGTRKCVLDVSGLPSGTYFVTLTTAKGTGTQKLVIN